MANDLTKRDEAGLPAHKVSTPVRAAISDLLQAFAVAAKRDTDREIVMRRLYVEAITGFADDVVLRVLRHLVLHNPRNPFHPTAQDIREACTEAAAAKFRDYLATLSPELREAREEVRRQGGWHLTEDELIAAARRLLV